jgi:enterochelin esterase-like enzyme
LKRWRLAALVAVLFLSACWQRKEAFERAPLARGQIEVVRLSERTNLAVERVRFWSNEMNEPRFFLALVPKTKVAPSEVFILNHGWRDRPEDLLKHLKVDQIYDEMLGRQEVRSAIVILPDVRFDSFYREFSDRFPYPNYLTLVAEEVAGTVSRRYGIPFERQRWAIGGFSFGGYLSLDVGRRYPGRFSSVSVVSGLVDKRGASGRHNRRRPGHSIPKVVANIQSLRPVLFPDFSLPAARMIGFSLRCAICTKS